MPAAAGPSREHSRGGRSPIEVFEGFAKIHEEAACAEPLLIYLRPEDVRAHLARTRAERDAGWGGGSWPRSRAAGGRARGLSGEEAVIGFYEDWEAVARKLYDRHTGPKLWLSDLQAERGAALAKVYHALGG